MKREDIIGHIESYEASHAVEEYTVNGWHVWPLLKMIPCMGYLPQVAPLTRPSGGWVSLLNRLRTTSLYRSYRWFRNRKYQHHTITDDWDHEHHDPHDAQRDVIILTLSERRVSLRGALYEIYSDPLVEQLQELGMSTLVWEQGEERYPRYSKSAWITRRMNAECQQFPLTAQFIGEPRWFGEYQKFAGKIMERAVMWHEVAALIDVVSNRATVFERWLKKTGARCLFSVCWYDPLVMAATMAARRCGIKTIEIQHGSQGKLHFAYSAWLRGPAEGYEVVPDVFWCWGRAAVNELQEYNPAFFARSSAVPGGNLWLNRWRAKATHASMSVDPDKGKTILVSLQLDVEPLLLDAIRMSPAFWRWLIRFHPSREMPKREQEEQVFRNLGHPGIELERANSLTFYELLGESDVHVTGWSSCAIEALAFGVPSAIISSLGWKNFSRLISQDLMMLADTSEKLIINIERAQRINLVDNHSISGMYASDEEANEAMQYILKQKTTKARES